MGKILGRKHSWTKRTGSDMIRKDSLIADAKYATQRNQEKSSNSTNQDHRHEIVIRSERNGDKFSLAYIIKSLEDYDIEVQSVHMKHPADESMNEIDNGPLDVYIQCTSTYEELQTAENNLRKNASTSVKRLSHIGPRRSTILDVPWFPRNATDLNYTHHLKEKSDDNPIKADHPGYSDKEYRERRRKIIEVAQNYRLGEDIPEVHYCEDEIKVWNEVYSTLKPLHLKGACSTYLRCLEELENSGLYTPEAIPSLQKVSSHLQGCSGFRLRPVGGLVSPRDFLASLALKVFQCTQYIRHSRSPMHTPEPDCCHELIGHVPMLCDPEFARFSQEIGIISLGASDEEIEKLASLYWFTVEFGLCREDGNVKAYGAGILSAFGELQHALSGAPELREFDPNKAAVQPYEDTEYQPVYFVASSFEDALSKVRDFADKSIKKPFHAHFDPTTASVHVLRKNHTQDVALTVKNLKDHIDVLRNLVG